MSTSDPKACRANQPSTAAHSKQIVTQIIEARTLPMSRKHLSTPQKAHWRDGSLCTKQIVLGIWACCRLRKSRQHQSLWLARWPNFRSSLCSIELNKTQPQLATNPNRHAAVNADGPARGFAKASVMAPTLSQKKGQCVAEKKANTIRPGGCIGCGPRASITKERGHPVRGRDAASLDRATHKGRLSGTHRAIAPPVVLPPPPLERPGRATRVARRRGQAMPS